MTSVSSDSGAPRRSAPPAVRRAVEVWHRLECWIAVTAFGFIAVILVLDVLGREFLGPVSLVLGFDLGATTARAECATRHVHNRRDPPVAVQVESKAGHRKSAPRVAVT